MASIYEFKPRFQAALRPVLNWLARGGATPNMITGAAIIGSMVAGTGLLFARERSPLLLILPVWLLARMALNALDGMLAREHHMTTPLGAALNELGDVMSDLAIYLPLAILFDEVRWPVIAFSIGAVLTEFSGLLGQVLGGMRRYDGPMGKSDRALLAGTLGLVTFFVPQARTIWPWAFGLGAVLALWTCWNRVRRALIELGTKSVARPSDGGDE